MKPFCVAIIPGAAETTDTTETPTKEEFAVVVNRLSKLSPHDYDKVRKAEASASGVRPGTLDEAVKFARKGSDSTKSPFKEVEPWGEPVNGAELLTDITCTIRRFIICEPQTAHATALWIFMAWMIDFVEVAPLAVITAPEKECGKTLLLTLIGKLAPRPLTSSSITPSALFRSIDLWQPTLLIDETDACLKDNEELRGLINCGHTRDSAHVIRCVGDDHTPTKFNVWGAKALSGIGHVAETLMSRALILELRRKLPHEEVDRLRYAEPLLFENLRSKLARFADDNGEAVRRARPDLPAKLNDRAQDNWEPLLAIASVAGGDWVRIATAAALRMAGNETASISTGAELLQDIREIFESKAIDRISTAELIKALMLDDEKPWSTFNKGFPIKPRDIAAKLKGYGIHSKTIRTGYGETPKGYELAQFQESFSRYIPEISATTQQSNDTECLNVADSKMLRIKPPQAGNVAVADVADKGARCGHKNENATDKSLILKECCVVADKNPVSHKVILSSADVAELTTDDFIFDDEEVA